MSPLRPKKPCRAPGCPELTDEKYCEKHQKNNPDKQRWRDLDRTRGNSAERGYDARWREFRTWYLHQHPMCEATAGCNSPAEELHHIHPVSDTAWYEANPGAMRDQDNVQALCHQHHLSTGNRGGKA
jgi:5-methylcytosine-specific restriction protein A